MLNYAESLSCTMAETVQFLGLIYGFSLIMKYDRYTSISNLKTSVSLQENADGYSQAFWKGEFDCFCFVSISYLKNLED